MPDERLITQIENIFADIVQLGGANERTSIVPNLVIQDANPTGIDGFVIVSDDRDGDNILAKKLGSVVYSDGDQVNVLFVEGGEAIAYQQGSESTNSGIWEIVPSTSTDISYDKGDVGIGKSVAPDAALEVLDTSQAQLRLSHTEDTKFVDFTLDTNHDLTIKPSSTGQIKLQPTSDSVDFFQVLDADGGTPVFNVDTVNERVGIGTASPGGELEISDGGTALTVSPLLISADTDTHILQITSEVATSSSPQLLRFIPVIDPGGVITSIFGTNINPQVGGSSSNNITSVFLNSSRLRMISAYNGTVATLYNYRAQNVGDTSSGSPAVTTHYGYYAEDLTFATNNWAFYAAGTTRSYFGGDIGIGITPQSRLHAYDSISGFMIWEYDGLDTTVRTVIANGTGDVLYRLHAAYVLRDGAAAVASGTTDVSNGASVNLTVGTNTVRLRVNADGSTDIARIAGTNTIKVSLVLNWL